MAKLTKTQEVLVNNMKAAHHFYKHDGDYIAYAVYIDGKPIAPQVVTGCYIKGTDLVTTKANTTTLKALEKKGVIELLEVGGQSLDTVRLIGHTFEAPHTQLRLINIEKTEEGSRPMRTIIYVNADKTAEEALQEIEGSNPDWWFAGATINGTQIVDVEA